MKQLTGLDTSFLNLETSTSFGHISSLSIYQRPTGNKDFAIRSNRSSASSNHSAGDWSRSHSASIVRTGSATPTSILTSMFATSVYLAKVTTNRLVILSADSSVGPWIAPVRYGRPT